MKIRLLLALMSFSFASFAQININLELQANVPVGEAGNDIWGYVDDNGIEYAVMGSQTATRIFSLEDKTNPIERAVINGSSSIWRDIKHYDNYLYVTTDTGQDGLLIIDMSNAPGEITHKFWTPTLDAGNGESVLEKCHNLYVDADEGWCYLAGCNIGRGGVLILDIHTDPLNPIHVGSTNEFYSHDVVSLGDIIYSSEINEGHFSVYDVTDRTNPQRTTLQTTTSNFTHNAWPSDDGRYLFTTDERPNAFLDAYDISDPEDVQRLDAYQPLVTANNNVIPHNTHYDDGFLVTSWYTDGLVIVDGNKPDNLVKVAGYDTYIGPDGGFSGCWGVYPYLPSGVIIASDINTGLYVFEPNIVRACYLEGNVIDKLTGAPINMARVEIDATQVAYSNTNASGDFKTGLATAGTYTINASHPDYIPGQVEVTLENGMVTDVTIELQKLEQVQLTGLVLQASDGAPIEGAQVIAISGSREVVVSSDANGEFDMALFGEDYVMYAGAWGYKEKQKLNFNPLDTDQLEFRLDQGYKDDFVVDQGWTVAANAETGNWQRAEPRGTGFQGIEFAPDLDSQNDLYGDQAYVTGNNGFGAGEDDVDDGITTLTSKPMDLSNEENPTIRFTYWFMNAGGMGGPPDDALTVSLSDGSTTVEVASFAQSNPFWIETEIDPTTAFADLSNITISFETGDTEASGHLVEAGIDKFYIGDFVSSTAELSQIDFEISPNPFTSFINLENEHEGLSQYVITDAMGKVVLTGKIDQNVQQINTSSLTGGIYFIQLFGKDVVGKAMRIVKAD